MTLPLVGEGEEAPILGYNESQMKAVSAEHNAVRREEQFVKPLWDNIFIGYRKNL